jgi:hypothetical protein
MSLSKKLSAFAAGSIAVILVLCAVEAISFIGIEKNGRMKDVLHNIARQVEENRLVEKTYLQFYTDELEQRFYAMTKDVSDRIQSLSALELEDAAKEQIDRINTSYALYRDGFQQVVSVYKEHQLLKQKMTLPLQDALSHLGKIESSIIQKQAELQMEGDDISQSERDVLNLVRDCKIVFLQLQNLQNQFLTTGNTDYIDKFKQLSGGNAQAYIASLKEFSISLNSRQFQDSADIVKASLETFLGMIGQSLACGQKQNEWVRQLDTEGGNIITLVQDEF